MPGFSANENAPHRSWIAYGLFATTPAFFGWRQIAQVGAMPFPGVHYLQAACSPGRQKCSVWLDSSAQLPDVVAEHFTETARFQKVALHINDQEGALLGAELERIGFSWDGNDLFSCRHILSLNCRPCVVRWF